MPSMGHEPIDLPHRLATGIAWARAGLGTVALVAPGVVARPWIGQEADDPGSAVLGRALAGRDLALALGLILADRHDQRIRGWVEAAALADLVDAGITLVAFRNLPRGGRVAVLAAAGGAAVVGLLAARSLS